MAENKYKSTRIIDGKPRQVIVDNNGKIIDNNPSKDELNNIQKEPYQKKKKYTNEELLNCLREFEKKNGRIPVDDEFSSNFEYPSVWNYHERFGSWSNALKLAGLHAYMLTDDELLNHLTQFHIENGRVPEKTDFTNNSRYPSYSTYRRRFGSWNRSIELSGLKKEPNYKYTDDQLLEYLRQFYRETGTTPQAADFATNQKYPGSTVYQKRFGSWNNAIKMSGLKINCFTKTSDNELLDLLKMFYNDNGRPPVQSDFVNNSEYPSFVTYQDRFGSWQKALKLAELDIDTMARKGILETTQQKGRLFEIFVKEHFINKPIDLSEMNYNSPFDGICPDDQNYEAKSAALAIKSWTFTIHNVYKEEIEWFYLGAFDKDFKKLLHVWRVPGEFIEGNSITIGINNNYMFNVENMKEFEITDKFKDIIEIL